ncbi:MAG: DUF192 domain-containing protein [Candidatus Omnitrophota bacterium]
MKRLLIICGIYIATIVFFCMISYISHSDEPPSYINVKIKEQIYTFELADNAQKRQQGLMFRKKLNEDSGMLFVHDAMDHLGFYMKNTYVPLDIAFIDKDYVVVDIQSMKPLDETLVVSRYRAQFALEVNKGFFKRAGLTIRDKIEFIPHPEDHGCKAVDEWSSGGIPPHGPVPYGTRLKRKVPRV